MICFFFLFLLNLVLLSFFLLNHMLMKTLIRLADHIADHIANLQVFRRNNTIWVKDVTVLTYLKLR